MSSASSARKSPSSEPSLLGGGALRELDAHDRAGEVVVQVDAEQLGVHDRRVPGGERDNRRRRGAGVPSARTTRSRRPSSPGGHKERLRRPPERPPLVVERRVGEPDAVGLRKRHGVEADPLPGRKPVEVDAQIHVDEEEASASRASPRRRCPESATTRTRPSGEISSPATTWTLERIHTVAGPGSTNAPSMKRYSTAEW